MSEEAHNEDKEKQRQETRKYSQRQRKLNWGVRKLGEFIQRRILAPKYSFYTILVK